MTSAVRDRVRDCLLTGLVGDAWGFAYEGAPRGAKPFPAKPRLSDDSALTLATCEAIVECGGSVEPEAIAHSFSRWFRAGRVPGIGSSTLKALRDLSAGGHWALSGARGDMAAGCGAAIRAAPLAFVLDPRSLTDRRTIRDIARITHQNDEAYAGALAVVLAIHAAFDTPGNILAVVAQELPDTLVRDRVLQLSAFPGSLAEATDLVGTSGRVSEAVPLALFAASKCVGQSAEKAIAAAVECGGDSDSIASMCGQVLGASGTAPPSDLLAQVEDVQRAIDVVSAFASCVGA